MYVLAIFLAIIAFGDCSVIPPTRIVNGTDAVVGEIPYIVSLRYNSRHTCGGSILSSEWVLTAAHCVDGRSNPPSSFSIQYGLLQIRSDYTNSITAERIIQHANYVAGGGYYNDIAIVKLVSPIPFSANARPVVLPQQGQGFEGWSPALLAGWGLPYTGGSVMENLQRVDLVLFPDDLCESAHNYRTNRNYHVCAGVPEGGKGQCNGDSGGPLIVNGIQVGIVSWSVKPCTIEGYPGVFARVDSYIDWIAENQA